MRIRWNLIAWGLLTSVFTGMAIYLLLNPSRTGVVPNYRMAVENWWACKPIYGTAGTHGFLYFPQFIIFYTPFELIHPVWLGEILWRAFGFGSLAWGLWKAANLISSTEKFGIDSPVFVTLVLLAVPASLASLNNGQTNLPLSACLVLSVLAIREQRWNLAAIWLCLMVVLKPIGLAPWLLALVVFPKIRKPLLIGLFLLTLLGVIHPDQHYVSERWEACIAKIFRSYRPESLRVSDLFGMLDKAGIVVPVLLETVTRALACLSALGFVFWKFQRGGSLSATWGLWVASALVFTVFNPRAETNSYVLISPLLAFLAADHLLRLGGNRLGGWILAAACLGLMCDGMGLFIYKATDVWLKPLIVLVVSPLLFLTPPAWKGAKK